MKALKNTLFVCAVGLVVVTLIGCSKRVMVPPRIDLQTYRAIGMIEFDSNAEDGLQQFVSQKFVETLQSSQPGIRILDLGSEEKVLEEIQHQRFDYQAIRAVGERYGVDAVIIGNLEVTDIKPKVDVSTLLMSMSARADVEAALTARLFDAVSGATIWTNSARGKQTVAQLGLTSKGPIYFDASDPDNAYGKLIGGLVYRTTHDFRVQYVRQ
ncbi:MAG: hypothetical protein OEN01_07840 [Candidatus Krumholzibacteria bacterium]|nr:hypothetical protein [Candidatus Krumholzibacteria bacterium]